MNQWFTIIPILSGHGGLEIITFYEFACTFTVHDSFISLFIHLYLVLVVR